MAQPGTRVHHQTQAHAILGARLQRHANSVGLAAENVYKIYAESFKDQTHLDTIVHQAQQIVGEALAGQGVH
jgi:phosphoglucomutase